MPVRAIQSMARKRRGNPHALMKAVQRNPRMTASAKRKALMTLQRQTSGYAGRPRTLSISRQRYRPPRTTTRSQGWEGVKLVAEGTTSIVSEPARRALDVYRIAIGVDKIRKSLKRKSR